MVGYVECDEMRDLFRQGRCNLATHGEHAALDGLFVAGRYVSTADDDLAHEERGIWTICSWVLDFTDLK